jgi:hypothetical protein
MAVHIGARVCALAEPGEILVTKTVVDLVVGSGLRFAERGEHELKGVPGTWRMYAVLGQSAADRAPAGPAETTGADRMTLRIARRAPGALRTLGRLTHR